MSAEQLPHRRWSQGPGKQEALHHIAPVITQALQLFDRLHSFCNDFHIQLRGHIDHRLHDLRTSRIVMEMPHKALVDLEHVKRQLKHIAQRRVPGAEIVERDADPQCPEASQQSLHVVESAQQHGFRHFQLEQAGTQAGLSQHGFHALKQARLRELMRRNIDAHTQGAAVAPVPKTALATGFSQDLPSEFNHQSGILRERHELRGRNPSVLQVSPPSKRFKTGNGVALQAVAPMRPELIDGLIEHLDALFVDGRAKVGVEAMLVTNGHQHLRSKHLHPVSPEAFSPVHGAVRCLEQDSRVRTRGSERNARACSQVQHSFPDDHRPTQKIKHLLRQETRLFLRHCFEQEHELISAGASQQIALSHPGTEQAGNLLNDQIAERVPKAVIHQLKTVHVDKDHARSGTVERAPLKTPGEVDLRAVTVGKARQGIVKRRILETRLKHLHLPFAHTGAHGSERKSAEQGGSPGTGAMKRQGRRSRQGQRREAVRTDPVQMSRISETRLAV